MGGHDAGDLTQAAINTAESVFAMLELSLIHISEPTRQAEISYAVFCLKKKKENKRQAEIWYDVWMRGEYREAGEE